MGSSWSVYRPYSKSEAGGVVCREELPRCLLAAVRCLSDEMRFILDDLDRVFSSTTAILCFYGKILGKSWRKKEVGHHWILWMHSHDITYHAAVVKSMRCEQHHVYCTVEETCAFIWISKDNHRETREMERMNRLFYISSRVWMNECAPIQSRWLKKCNRHHRKLIMWYVTVRYDTNKREDQRKSCERNRDDSNLN
eukprot:CCRYP_003295-RA/>CCRYP_003295-RA protein AED:0.45 eAED:0.57 QI:0/0.5/0.33/1/0.5/0.33/3/142/195